jgi:hypothetical protein
MMIDWDNAQVTITVPVHGTESIEMQEIRLHIAQFADLIAGQVKVEGDALVAPDADPVALNIGTKADG